MKLRHIRPERIPFEWERMAKLLRPVLAFDATRDAKGIYQRLVSGRMQAFDLSDADASVLMVVEISEQDGGMICWLYAVSGTLPSRPRQFLSTVRNGLSQFETLLKTAGCTEVRIGGREWTRVLPDYQQYGDTPDLIRKVL